MSEDIIIEIDGVKGETPGSPKEIEIMQFAYGITNPGSRMKGTGGGSGTATFHDITITKVLCLASNSIANACATGLHIKQAKITQRKAGGGKEPVEFFTILLQNVIISSYGVSASSGGGNATETLTINYAEITQSYVTQTDKGGKGGKSTFNFNIPKGS